MKLWQKNDTHTLNSIEQFTVGRDKEFDLLLAPYDVQGSIAHVTMLGEVGLLTAEEAAQAVTALQEIAASIAAGTFCIEEGVEDVHSQVELLLTRSIGDTGKKIHTGRSRNDQVAVDIKLYLRHELQQIKTAVAELFTVLTNQSEAHKNVLLPGYTHLQVAMPSSAGLWLGAYAESLVDDLQLLAAAYAVVNKNPLGSAAGYGSSFPLNRQRTTDLLGFASLHYNSVYAQMSRGKTEKFVATGMAAIAATVSRLAMDCCLYMSQNFAFISLPDALTTGSSIMPHKKNPDVFELTRAHCNRLQALPNELTLLVNNLPSGYHRDMQLTKEILFPAIETLKNCLQMTTLAIGQLQFAPAILAGPQYQYIYSVDAVNALVQQGVPFRDSYQQVGNAIAAGSFTPPAANSHQHTHEGSIGNLCTAEIVRAMEGVLGLF